MEPNLVLGQWCKTAGFIARTVEDMKLCQDPACVSCMEFKDAMQESLVKEIEKYKRKALDHYTNVVPSGEGLLAQVEAAGNTSNYKSLTEKMIRETIEDLFVKGKASGRKYPKHPDECYSLESYSMKWIDMRDIKQYFVRLK